VEQSALVSDCFSSPNDHPRHIADDQHQASYHDFALFRRQKLGGVWPKVGRCWQLLARFIRVASTFLIFFSASFVAYQRRRLPAVWRILSDAVFCGESMNEVNIHGDFPQIPLWQWRLGSETFVSGFAGKTM
jgi:hypothetical protein